MTVLGQKPTTLILWVVLALPALPMIGPLFGDDARAFHRLLHPTGEWAARFMIIGMMASGLMLLFKGQSWPRWLVHHRRDIEVAAFVYAALHTAVYVIDRGTLETAARWKTSGPSLATMLCPGGAHEAKASSRATSSRIDPCTRSPPAL